MADEPTPQTVPPMPPREEIVTTTALYNTQIALYRNTLAFSGVRNPTMIWSAMVRNDPSAMLYYREIEEKDEDVSNALDTLKEKALEHDWSVKPFDESSQAADVAEFVRDELGRISYFDSVLDNMLDAPGYGFSIQELMFDTSEGQASLAGIKDCPQELFLFGQRYQVQIGNLQFLDSPYASSGNEVPEEKFLIYSHRPRSRDRMGRPLLRSVFWPSWFKRNVQSMWLKYAEKGPGTAVVRYQDSDDAGQQQQAAELAFRLINEVAVGVPQNFDFEKDLLTIARSLDPATYEHLYKAMQLNISRRIKGETLTSFGSEDGRGSQAQGETHSATLETKAIRLCKALAGVLNEQLVRRLVLWNFGPLAPMPTFAFETEEKEDLTERMAIDQGMQRMGVPMPLSYLQTKYQVPTPQEGEMVAVPNATAPQPNITARTQFAEARITRQAHAELAQLDTLIAGMQGDAKELMRQRMQEVVQQVRPAMSRRGQ